MDKPLKCAAMGCNSVIGNQYCFCGPHWRLIDNSFKFQINRFRSPEGFPEYDEAFRALLLVAILHVAEAEADDDYELKRSAMEMVNG